MEVILVIVLLAGCGAPTATLAPIPTLPTIPTLPPIPTIPTPAPPLATVKPTGQPVQPTGQTDLFKFLRTVPVTPDDNFLTGSSGYVHYVHATDRVIVMLSSDLAKPIQGFAERGNAYKEFTLDMQPTGKYGFLSSTSADMTSTMVDDTLYVVNMKADPGKWIGWHLVKYDAVSWKLLAEIDIPLDTPKEEDGGPTVAYVNGQVVVSGEYNLDEGTPDPGRSEGTHHHFFSTDLVPQGKRILKDTLHKPEGTMIYGNDAYYYVASSSYWGDLIVLKYDTNWKYLGTKTLRKQANFPTGVVYDDQRFYVAYIDTTQRTDPGVLPVFMNIYLAAFDRDWNLVEDMAVTNFSRTDNLQAGSPYVMLHDQKVYVSYTVDEMDPVTHAEHGKWQAYVSVFELTQSSSP